MLNIFQLTKYSRGQNTNVFGKFLPPTRTYSKHNFLVLIIHGLTISSFFRNFACYTTIRTYLLFRTREYVWHSTRNISVFYSLPPKIVHCTLIQYLTCNSDNKRTLVVITFFCKCAKDDIYLTVWLMLFSSNFENFRNVKVKSD